MLTIHKLHQTRGNLFTDAKDHRSACLEKNAYLKDLDTLIPFLSLEMVYEDYRTKTNRARDSSFPQTPMKKFFLFFLFAFSFRPG